MRSDQFGYEVTVSSPKAAQDWNATVLGFLAHSASTPGHLAETLKAEPDFAMALATKGLFLLLLGRRELVADAQAAHAAARASLARNAPTARECAYVDGLAAWLDGRPSGTVAAMERVLAQWPEDGLAMKLSQAVRFVLGDNKGMRQSVEAVIERLDLSNPARGYAFGCHAFALEETGEYARAETAGRMGLSLAADDAWGLHAVAHVYDMTANARAGLNWLEGREGAWAHCNNFRYHVWWHKALLHLDQGEIDAVLRLYDTEIRRDRTDDYRDISNGTSLLMRLELEGIDVGDRWEEMADICERRTEDAMLIFADLHYLLALIGGQRDTAVQQLLASLHHGARVAQPDEMQARMAAPGLSAATGLEAFATGDFQTAFLNLGRARRNMQLAGGSHAQRDVFERITIDAGIRAGFLDEAAGILHERTALRGGCRDAYAQTRLDLMERSRGAWTKASRQPAE
mgnify:CR=1 FL=1